MTRPAKSRAILSEYCSCLAFYSARKQDIDYKSIYFFFLALAKKNDCLITHGGITGDGYISGLKSIRTINKQLEANSYQGIVALTLYSVASEQKTYNDWQFYASVMSSPETQHCELTICLDDKYDFFRNNLLTSSILEVNNLFHVDYAIGYIRAYNLGPHYYASGVSQGLERNSIEAERIAEWFRAILNNTFFDKNILRDVYPINILNNEQLQTKLTTKGILGFQSSTTLESWITKNDFGQLTKMTERLWLWEVKREIDNISQELCRNRILLYCISEKNR